jgi:hypothetical protein
MAELVRFEPVAAAQVELWRAGPLLSAVVVEL